MRRIPGLLRLELVTGEAWLAVVQGGARVRGTPCTAAAAALTGSTYTLGIATFYSKSRAVKNTKVYEVLSASI